MPTKIEKVSEFIFQSHQHGDAFSNLENDMKPQDFAEAYEIQKSLRQKLPRGPLGGYKIALSSKIQQDYHNITQPVYGGLFRKEIFNSPKVLVLKNYHRMSVEFELAFELSTVLQTVQFIETQKIFFLIFQMLCRQSSLWMIEERFMRV